jgi:uncharacterized membrane protein YgdD (TMEM256/DUF423 family)
VRIWLAVGALSALVAVAMGAAGAHATGDAQAALWLDKASRYQMYHALALLAVGILSTQRPSRMLHAAGIAFTVGTVLFSGSLYAMAFGGAAATLMTPAGGLCFMLGWLLLALSALRRSPAA